MFVKTLMHYIYFINSDSWYINILSFISVGLDSKIHSEIAIFSYYRSDQVQILN